jgi:methylphosphotriester-DNA--protein-cysteine methyltransferase
MSEELKVDPKQAADVQEAELAAQNMVEGTEKVPEIDVESDYEASKEYSVSDVDKTEQ